MNESKIEQTEKCFICYEDESIPDQENLNFFRPCARNDSNSNCNIWAHQGCLTHWLKQSQNQKCSTCGQAYIVANGPPNIIENTMYLLGSTIGLVYEGLNTLYLLTKFFINKYRKNFQSNILQSNFWLSRLIIQVIRTTMLFYGFYQIDFGQNLMNLTEMVALFFLGMTLFGYLTFLVNLSDEVLVEYLTTDIQIPDLSDDALNQLNSRERDKINKLKDMQSLQEQYSYKIYRYIIKTKFIQLLFPFPNSINFYFIQQTIINYGCSICTGYIYYHYIQSFWLGQYLWNLKVFGQSYYLIGLFVRSIMVPSFISYFERLKLQVISLLNPLHGSNSDSYFDFNWTTIKLKLFPNINPKYPYHNFDEKYPELDNKHPIPPPNNYYRPCYNCRQKVDLAIIPNHEPNSALPPPAYCPNEKCDHIPYIPNTPLHQKKYMLTCFLELMYDSILLFYYINTFLWEEVSFFYKCFLIFGICTIVYYDYLNPMKFSRGDIVSYINFLNEHEIEREYPEVEENPANPISYRELTKHMGISLSFFGGIFEFGLKQIVDYLSICPKYIWFTFSKFTIHQISVRFIYPLIYSYLYEQSPKDFMESELFSYTFSNTIALPYAIITCIILPCITYIQKRTTTNYIHNPKIPQAQAQS